MILFSACTTRTQRIEKEGQQQPLSSPTGTYIVEMPILSSNTALDYPVWTPTIKNAEGEIVYKDLSSNLSGYHSSYWEWKRNDEKQRDELWVYNSDLGEVTVYYIDNDTWQKTNPQPQDEPPHLIKEKLHKYID